MVNLAIRARSAIGIFEVPQEEFDWTSPTDPFQRIVPGIAGFGTSTTAGSGRDDVVGSLAGALTVYHVTNLNLSGAGSLKAALIATGRRVIVPSISGIIDYEGQAETTGAGSGRNVIIGSGDVYFAGQCAPSPGLYVKGIKLYVNTDTARNVVIHHLGIFQAEYTDPGAVSTNGDCFGITGAAIGTVNANIVLANCWFSGSSDELADIFYGANNITFWQCAFAEPFHDNNHPNGPHGYGPLLTNDRNDTRACFLRCYFAHCFARNPASAAYQLTYANNVVFDPGDRCLQFEGRVGDDPSNNNVEGNVFIKGPSTTATAATPIHRANSNPANNVVAGSNFYIAGNRTLGTGWDDSTQAGLVSAGNGTLVSARIDDAWPIGYNVTPTTSLQEFVRLVMRDVGPRPGDRLPHIQRVCDHVIAAITGTGSQGGIINGPTDTTWTSIAGDWTSQADIWNTGYPDVAQNTVDHTIGLDPMPGISSMASGGLPLGNAGRTMQVSGYTALEEWFHRRHFEVMS